VSESEVKVMFITVDGKLTERKVSEWHKTV